MTTQNSTNLKVTNNSDGYEVSGGTTTRKLVVTGADITLTGSGTNTMTFPSSSQTLIGRTSTDTLTNKTLTSPVINSPTGIDTDDVSEATNLYYTDARVTANSSVSANTAKVTNATHTGDVTGSTALAIASNVIVNDDINSSAAISISKTALVAGTNITLSGDTLNVDDSFIKNNADDTSTGKITAANFAVTADNSTADTAYVPMVLYNTDATPPTASTVPIGTIYIQYTA